MPNIKELLGEELWGQVETRLKGQGNNGKDLEVIAANTGEYVPAAKHDKMKVDYERTLNDYNMLNSNYEKDINDAKAASESLLTRTLVAKSLEINNVAKVKGKDGRESYDLYLDGAIDLASVKIENGTVIGVDDVVSKFVTANPHLKPSQSTAAVPSATVQPQQTVAVPASTGLNPVNTQTNVKDRAYYESALKSATELEQKIQIIQNAQDDGIIIT